MAHDRRHAGFDAGPRSSARGQRPNSLARRTFKIQPPPASRPSVNAAQNLQFHTTVSFTAAANTKRFNTHARLRCRLAGGLVAPLRVKMIGECSGPSRQARTRARALTDPSHSSRGSAAIGSVRSSECPVDDFKGLSRMRPYAPSRSRVPARILKGGRVRACAVTDSRHDWSPPHRSCSRHDLYRSSPPDSLSARCPAGRHEHRLLESKLHMASSALRTATAIAGEHGQCRSSRSGALAAR